MFVLEEAVAVGPGKVTGSRVAIVWLIGHAVALGMLKCLSETSVDATRERRLLRYEKIERLLKMEESI